MPRMADNTENDKWRLYWIHILAQDQLFCIWKNKVFFQKANYSKYFQHNFVFFLLHITINKICNHFDNTCQIGLFTKQYLLKSITKGTVCNSTYHISPCILFKILFLHCKIYQQTWVLNRQQYFQFFPILLSNHKIVKWDNYN